MIDASRLWARVEALSRFTRPDLPWTRRAFSAEFDAARQWLRAQFTEAGMAVTQDDAGNLIGRLPGRRPELRPIVTGSHCDTVPLGGRFDGIIGVLAGIEIAMCLRESGQSLEHDFEVIDFLSEEPSDYGISCIGSRGLSGKLTPTMLEAKNPDGETLAQGMRRLGCNTTVLASALREPDSTAAFIELHIEQGPVLERQKLPVGVVTNIVGIRRVAIVVDGQPDHAGTTPMDIRHDALVGAAHIIESVNRNAGALTGKPHYLVATIGRIQVTPNASNAVPGKAEMILEVRSENQALLNRFPELVFADAAQRLRETRVRATMSEVSTSAPTDCSPMVMDAIERAASKLGQASTRMPSGAGHDAVYMKPTGPIGMIFIPCLNGRSHCPEEWTEPGQLAAGASVLFQTIWEIDRQLAVDK